MKPARLLLVLAMTLGCEPEPGSGRDADSPDTDAALDSGSDGAQPSVYFFRALYFVPERSALSTYPVAEAGWIRDGDRVSLGYTLPPLLVGQAETVAMTGTMSADRSSAEISGPLGSAVCDLVDGLPVSCRETFTALEVDLGLVRREAERLDAANVDARVEVATRFRNDPIGVIEIADWLDGPVTVERCTVDAECEGMSCYVGEGAPGICSLMRAQERGAACRVSFECEGDMVCDAYSRTCQPAA